MSYVSTYAKTLGNDDARHRNLQRVPLHLPGGWLSSAAAALVCHHRPAVDASFGESSISYQRQSPWLFNNFVEKVVIMSLKKLVHERI